MKWLKRKIFVWAQQGGQILKRDNQYEETGLAIGSLSNSLTSRKGSNIGNSNSRMNFTLHKANGGYIVEYSTYDENTDRHYESLHIIGSDEDFADSLGKIIFVECLKK